ncbi:MAG: hypothetical protein EZS28_019504 [Streblomastix strix]|uniref:Uncharacterized protein n=1 Tax=Streblomastix strix TaxID=222440 RepID=A0A5J4VQN9_9EUKA|nr:MAG: hypothetical protein EZS28_019504 [Streblomastix strix]
MDNQEDANLRHNALKALASLCGELPKNYIDEEEEHIEDEYVRNEELEEEEWADDENDDSKVDLDVQSNCNDIEFESVLERSTRFALSSSSVENIYSIDPYAYAVKQDMEKQEQQMKQQQESEIIELQDQYQKVFQEHLTIEKLKTNHSDSKQDKIMEIDELISPPKDEKQIKGHNWKEDIRQRSSLDLDSDGLSNEQTSSEFIPDPISCVSCDSTQNEQQLLNETDSKPLVIEKIKAVISDHCSHQGFESIIAGDFDKVPDSCPITFYGDFQIMKEKRFTYGPKGKLYKNFVKLFPFAKISRASYYRKT